MLNRGPRKKKDHQRQFPVDSFHFFTTSWRKMPAPGPFFPSSRSIFVASTGRIYLRWVYLRTKWFLFGPRASCASHGGFVAAIAAAAAAPARLEKESETGQQEQRRATRWRRTSTCSSSSWPLSTFPPTSMTFVCVRLCNCACMCVRPT